MPRGIFETLRERISKGELVGLIEQEEGERHRAWLTVFQGLSEEFSQKDIYYKSPLIVHEQGKRLTILSDHTFILKPSQPIAGRVGFHPLRLSEEPQEYNYSVCFPQEVYVGEFQINNALRRFPELAGYSRLFDIYPCK